MEVKEYHKIDTLFLRDEKNIIIPYRYTRPEFEVLANTPWIFTEKIDGTNTRIEIDPDGTFEFHGRTSRAIMPPLLIEKLKEIFTEEKIKKFIEDNSIDCHVTIYGEGYGKGIQKAGSHYIKNGVDFILFDVYIGRTYLQRDSLEDIAERFGIKTVPLYATMTLPDAIAVVNRGFTSKIAEEEGFPAEGLVGVPACGFLDRRGRRVITKIKTEDFNKYRTAYGEYNPENPIVQTPNTQWK